MNKNAFQQKPAQLAESAPSIDPMKVKGNKIATDATFEFQDPMEVIETSCDDLSAQLASLRDDDEDTWDEDRWEDLKFEMEQEWNALSDSGEWFTSRFQ